MMMKKKRQTNKEHRLTREMSITDVNTSINTDATDDYVRREWGE